MKKFLVAMTITALTVSAYAMGSDPAAAKTESTEKTCAIKEADAKCCGSAACATDKAACTADKAACEVKKAECTAEKAACDVKKAACSAEKEVACEAKKAECTAEKAACDAKKAACSAEKEVKKTECAGGVCPMPK